MPQQTSSSTLAKFTLLNDGCVSLFVQVSGSSSSFYFGYRSPNLDSVSAWDRNSRCRSIAQRFATEETSSCIPEVVLQT